MRRGFKAAAERHATDLREATGCSESETIDLSRLAYHLKVAVLGADKVLGGVDKLQSLHEEQEGAFSGATFVLPGRTIVIYNPIDLQGRYISPAQAKYDGRIRSNVAHEFGHLILGHEVRDVTQIAGQAIFTCNPEQEAEATWLGGCLLLPRKLLLAAAYRGDTDEAVAHQHCVSPQMAAFRMRTSGARMQAARGRSSRPRR